MMNALKIKKPANPGLAVRRFVVFAAPLLVIVGALGANVVMSAFKPKPEEKEEIVKATPVIVATAEQRPVTLTVTAQGEAAPRREINLASEVSGKIVYVSPEFIEGGAFEKGDVLVKIAAEEYKYRVIQARSNVAQAKSRFASEEAEATIARKEWQELGDGEGAPLTLREPQMAEAAALLASARAALDEAELQLERTTIRAPFKGRVRSKSADIGNYVTPGAVIGEVFGADIMQVALPLTDEELGQLGLEIGYRETIENPGPDVKLEAVVAGVPRAWRGRIARTDSGYDRETRVLFAYAEVDDPYGAGADNGAPLAAGLFVTAHIAGRSIDDGVVVPRVALRGEQEIYIAGDDNSLEIRQVRVASSNRDEVILVGGVEEGERVIVSPVRGAVDGIKVAIAGGDEGATATVADASN